AGNNPKIISQILTDAHNFKGTTLIEVLQNCVIFNDGCYDGITGKEVKEDMQIYLEHGKPIIFGKNRNKGLKLNGLKLEMVTIGENGITEADILVHDAKEKDPTLHQMLIRLENPLVTGIVRSVEEPTLVEREDELTAQIKARSTFTKTDDLFYSGEIYEVL
ncbi:MAG TPA: hypothetical protein VK927_07440, partial [Adhaeribacter sp.]|nr:hypothetical protein [Adhaeribacter sp.]